MTYEQIYELMRRGTWDALDELYHEGMLNTYWLNLAVKQRWISIDDANDWYSRIMNI